MSRCHPLAKQIAAGNSTEILREDGDACQREGCTGLIHPAGHSGGQEIMECSGCHFTFATRFRLPAKTEDKNGKPPGVTIPAVLVQRFAVLMLQRNQENAVPNPNDRTEWDDLPTALQESWLRDAEALLTPIWTEVADWFGFSIEDREAQQNGVNAIQEIAIPALQHCEKHYNYGAQARKLLEAAIGDDS